MTGPVFGFAALGLCTESRAVDTCARKRYREKHSGPGLGSSYQRQSLTLSKHFKRG